MKNFFLFLFLIPFLSFGAQVVPPPAVSQFWRLELTNVNADSIAAKVSSNIVIQAVSELRLVTTGKTAVTVLGYYAAGDGGGGLFRYDATSVTATNLGTVFGTASGGRWLRVYNEKLNPLWFGAVTNTDCTLSFSNMYAVASVNEESVQLPNGVFIIDTLNNLGSVDTEGSGASDLANNWQGTILWQKAGSTNHMLNFTNYARASFRNVTLLGRRETNLRNAKTITTDATSRLRFFVAPLDAPPATAATGIYPFYSYCFFYNSQDRYIGSAIVETANTITGEITLLNGGATYGYDIYATDSSGFLRAGYKVCFAPSVTESNFLGTVTKLDPTSAGNAAINFEGVGVYQNFENLYIEGFHVGFRNGSALACRLNHIQFRSCSFAGYAEGFTGYGSDVVLDNIYVSGGYRVDWVSPNLRGTTETESISSNTTYRNTRAGVYLGGTANAFKYTQIYDTVYGVWSVNAYDNTFDTLIVDRTILDGVNSIASKMSIKELVARGVGVKGTGTRTCVVLSSGSLVSVGVLNSSSLVGVVAGNGFYVGDTSVGTLGYVVNPAGYTTLVTIGSDKLSVLNARRDSPTGQIPFNPGSALAPGLALIGSTNTGFFSTATTNEIDVAINGTEKLSIQTNVTKSLQDTIIKGALIAGGSASVTQNFARHYIFHSESSATDTFPGLYVDRIYVGSGLATAPKPGLTVYNKLLGTGGSSSSQNAVQSTTENAQSSGTVNTMQPMWSEVVLSSGGSTTSAAGNWTRTRVTGSGSLFDGVGYDVLPPVVSGSGGIGTVAGLRIQEQRVSGVTNAWGLVQLGFASTNHFAGPTSFGSTNSMNSSALLEVISTTKGFLLPRMTKVQRDAIATPADGLMVYQTDNTPGVRFRDNGAWVKPTVTADP